MKLFFIVLLFFTVTGCDMKDAKKEKDLNEREQNLIFFEQKLKAKEDSLLKLQHKQFIDTINSIDEQDLPIIGSWQVKMNCIETTCLGSAIGDTRSEKWNIYRKKNIVVAKAMSDEKVTRVYLGLLNGNKIMLTAQSSDGKTLIKVSMTFISASQLDGLREVIKSDDCSIIYALKLEKLQGLNKLPKL
ncbi:MAG: hypothetical protein ACYCZO_01365 [Daejeonella sp.]